MALELIFFYCGFLDDELHRPQLSANDKRRRDRRTPRIALRKYNQSAFYYLFKSGCNQALLNCCAVDHEVFSNLLELFKPVFDYHMWDESTGFIREVIVSKHGKIMGRRREIDATGCLGLVLYWYRTRGSVARATSMAFGLTSTPMYKWLKFGRRVLLFVLHQHPLAKVSLPSQDEIGDYVHAIGQKYPVLGTEKVWAAADGLKVPLQKSSNWAIQNQYYNGWQNSTYVNSVFVFAPDGRIRICTINAPGTFHDSTMADYGVYEKMETIYNSYGAKVVVDSAFNLQQKPFLIKSSQDDPVGDPDGVIVNRAATSVRQLSEHGMRMIQGQFPRLKDPLQLEEGGERRVILMLMVNLYNYQASTIGINHILNSFMSRTEGFYSYNITETANEIFTQ